MRYGELSALLAERVSPRELLEAAERSDFESLAAATGVGKERAARLLAYLRESGSLAALATSLVEDNVSFQLLDGQNYKQLADLSTGQRCTVVLPLILEHANRVLIIDQPEDHIDNAFIVDTLNQIYSPSPPFKSADCVDHNANIPLLGEAQMVIHLGWDGSRGYVEHSASLDDPQIEKAITTLMEGGAGCI